MLLRQVPPRSVETRVVRRVEFATGAWVVVTEIADVGDSVVKLPIDFRLSSMIKKYNSQSYV